MNCRLCGAETEARYTATLLGTHEATYHYCVACDHLYVGNPTWLDEAYSEGTAHHDTDVAVRNIYTALRLAAFYYWVLGERGQGRYVDVAGGHGLLTRLMRDLGFDCYGSDRYAKNLCARGFDAVDGPPAIATSAIEVLEHTTNPLEFIPGQPRRPWLRRPRIHQRIVSRPRAARTRALGLLLAGDGTTHRFLFANRPAKACGSARPALRPDGALTRLLAAPPFALARPACAPQDIGRSPRTVRGVAARYPARRRSAVAADAAVERSMNIASMSPRLLTEKHAS